MASGSPILRDNGNCPPGLSQTGGLIRDHTSVDNCTRTRSGTPTDAANLDVDTPTTSSSDHYDHGFSSEADQPTGDEDISQTEHDDSNFDEAFFESDASSTTSLDSSVRDYLLLHSRKYPNVDTGHSYEPIDETRRMKWDLNHRVYCELLGGLHKAAIPKDCQGQEQVTPINLPLAPIASLTDSYSGIWAMDFADERPEIEVIGTDISPIQPDWVPPNLKFEIEDCEQEWTFEDSSADYIHARGLNGNVDRIEFTKKVFKTLKPEGVVEFVEVCMEPSTKKGTLATNSCIEQWGDFFREAGKKRRKHFMVTNDGTLRQAMETVGFEDIEVYEYEIPIGPWPESREGQKVGQFGLVDFMYDIEGTMFRLGEEELKWNEDEIRLFAAELRNYVRLHWGEFEFYKSCIVVVGKRPS
ncbi:hypothetical protein RAB80_018272 [Fusarium oxysporum f. sp. vasinfectum]|uniref:Methyltransferase n=1 Tax=Fusarium oxysporum f. sp. vasinfectum 25433 TaxID=1089449 RepID=X0KZ98_FUSOX|nr:hypothetical protein FOTG_17569 [Fusarium oxysporum f. sp. vasinfectum 25433]KAK2666172.1 hypothetical protein RAB80_018272 [Fusarium oxysporum f. sp. vasinfectum]KAK2922346.1 hypothetical protein FoTM2_017702 [Fusarium oxysporum f. sp. vasinfectum]